MTFSSTVISPKTTWCWKVRTTPAAAIRAGGKPAMPKIELPGGMGWISGFIDPAGNWVGLWAPAKKPAAATKTSAKAVLAKKAPAKKKAAPKAKKKR